MFNKKNKETSKSEEKSKDNKTNKGKIEVKKNSLSSKNSKINENNAPKQNKSSKLWLLPTGFLITSILYTVYYLTYCQNCIIKIAIGFLGILASISLTVGIIFGKRKKSWIIGFLVSIFMMIFLLLMAKFLSLN